MKNLFIKEYIKNITEDDIIKFAESEGVTLNDDETKIIYLYLKNYWEIFISEDPTYLFNELKEKLKPETYKKLIEIYNKYKKMLN